MCRQVASWRNKATEKNSPPRGKLLSYHDTISSVKCPLIKARAIDEYGHVGKVIVDSPRAPASGMKMLNRSPSKVEPVTMEAFVKMDAELDRRPVRSTFGKSSLQQHANHGVYLYLCHYVCYNIFLLGNPAFCFR